MSLPSSRTATNHKSFESPSTAGSSSRRSSKITVEYHKPSRQSIQEYHDLLSNVNLHAAAAANYKDPFVPTRQTPPPPSSQPTSKPQDTSPSHHKSRHSVHKQSSRPRKHTLSTAPTILEAEPDPFTTAPSTPQEEHNSFQFPSTSSKDMTASSVPPTPQRPSRANTINLTDLYPDPIPSPLHATTSTPHLDGLPSESYADAHSLVTTTSPTAYAPSFQTVSPPPQDRTSIAPRSRSATVTAKGKKGMLGFMSDFLNSNKRLEISTPYDPVHLTHVGFNSSTGEFTGLPKEWQQLLQDSGISKSDQEKNPLAVMEIVKFYQEGGGDVWDKMGHAPAPGGSQSPPVPSTAQPTQPRLRSVDDIHVPPPVSALFRLHSTGILFLTIPSVSPRLRKRLSLPAFRRPYPSLTHQHRTALRHLHLSLRNPTLTARPHSAPHPNPHVVILSPAQTQPRTGALRPLRPRLKRQPETHQMPRQRTCRQSHKLLRPRPLTPRSLSVGHPSPRLPHSNRTRLLRIWQRQEARRHGDAKRIR
jgi:P21-Rho-binding domain